MRISKQAAAHRFETFRQSGLLGSLPRTASQNSSLADEKFELLKSNPRHGSLKLKKAGVFWSARIGRRYRAVAKERAEGLVWFWIGTHEEYNNFINRK